METLAQLTDPGIIPHLRPTASRPILPLLAALCSGGGNAAAFSIGNPLSIEALQNGSRLFPDLLLGISGIVHLADAQNAIRCGARFLSSVGFSQELASLCIEQDILYLPQCMTPTELLSVERAGLPAAGLFAPHLWGNDALLSSFASAFPKLKLIACGVPAERAVAIRSLHGVVACSVTGLENASPESLADECRTLILNTLR